MHRPQLASRRRTKPDRANLPVLAIGVGVVHAIGLAILLPLLITLPGPGGERAPKPVNIEVYVGSPAKPRPIVPNLSSARHASDEATSALPTSLRADGKADEPKSKDEAPGTLANINPEVAPTSAQDAEQEAAPSSDEHAARAAPARKAKPKVEAKGTKPAAKHVRAPSPKKPLLARGRPPLFKVTAARGKGQAPYQGSWSALLNAPPSVADVRR